MHGWEALILGAVEGLTEYLPVSSTGHLLVVERALGFEGSETARAFAIAIQAGAIAAVLVLYAGRVLDMLRGVLGRDPKGRALLIRVLAAFVPAAAVGFVFDKPIERHLFGPWPIVAAWTAGALAIALSVRHPRLRTPGEGAPLSTLSLQSAAIIGAAQCLALWPGTSRSLVTILAGVFVGLSLPAAVEFTFLLGLVTLGAATGFKAVQHGPEMVHAYGGVSVAIGFFSAWAVALAAVKWMVTYLSRHSLWVFAYWRLAAAVLVAGLLITGRF